MILKINPLSDAIGAEISGLDFSQALHQQDVTEIQNAFLQYHLLCLRSEPLSAEAFVALARNFGTPKLHVLRKRRHDDVPEVTVHDSTYKNPEDKPKDLNLDRRSAWHTDDSYFEAPAKATLLQGIQVPNSGGQTQFCNTRKAYENLSNEDKKRVDDLQAVHAYDTIRAPARAEQRTQQEESETPEVIHPLIRTHEDTNAKAFFFNPNRTDRIVDMERKKSDALLDWVHTTITQDKYRYNHEWRIGDILIWDNRCVVHSVNMDFPVGQTRLHHRILLEGSRPH